MRVAHITPCYYPAFAYGGPTRSVYGLTRALATLGADVRVLTTNANGRSTLDVTNGEMELEPRLRVRYARRAGFESTAPSLLRYLPELVQWADVVHLLGVYNFPTIPTIFMCRALNKPLAWSPRGALQRWAGTRRRRLKASWEAACRAVLSDRVVIHTTSASEANQVRERIPARVVVIPNGVDLPIEIRHVSGANIRLLFLGRLDPIKGLENLVQACALLKSGNLRFDLTIAGVGEKNYEASLHELVSQHALNERVSFVGAADESDKVQLFANADVLVLPSHSENFGIVVLEALAHEVPVIASHNTPWADLERKGCGLYVANEPHALAGAIQAMAKRDRGAMGEAGRRWVEEEFGWTAIGRRMLDCYGELLASH